MRTWVCTCFVGNDGNSEASSILFSFPQVLTSSHLATVVACTEHSFFPFFNGSLAHNFQWRLDIQDACHGNV